jgi:hypothetical protein
VGWKKVKLFCDTLSLVPIEDVGSIMILFRVVKKYLVALFLAAISMNTPASALGAAKPNNHIDHG